MAFATIDQLNWDVISRDLFVTVDGENIKVPGKKAQVRDDDNTVIGVTGTNYQVFQNSSLRGFITPLVEEGLLEIDNIGFLGRGEKVFIQAKMAEEFVVAGEETKSTITLLNSHDGSTALAGGVTTTRVVCGNTFAMAMGDMEARISHSKSLMDKASQITAVVNFVNDNMAKYTQAVEALSSTTATRETVVEMIEKVFSKDATSVRATENIIDNFYHGRGNSGKTLWDATNAFTEYFTHTAGKDDNARWVSTNFGRNATLSRKAMNIGLAMV